MPWRGPEVPGEYPTLGYEVAEWIEAHIVIPDGVRQGEPYRLTDEMLRFLLGFYRLRDVEPAEDRPSAPFVHRGGLLMRPQKWGKGPFAAALCLAEAFGPVLLDGWDADGEPVGRPWATPWVQIVATSEEQTDNTWLCVYESASRGPLAELPGVDIGLLDINLPSGGKIEPRSSSGRARLGARLTFAVFDESHQMVESNGGVTLASNMKRNLGGMGGRWVETTNAYDPTERSVAQRTHESRAPGLLVDYRPPSRRPDLDGDDQAALALLAEVYGDSWWVDRARILADARDPSVCPTTSTALRYFFNLPEEGEGDAVTPARWDAQARTGSPLQPRQDVALGFDGSRSRDCTSLVASRIADGRWFHLRSWNPADYDDGLVPRDEVHAAVQDAFGAYRVWYLYADPYKWQEYIDVWSALWPTRLDGRDGSRVVEYPTNVERRMDAAITRVLTLLDERSLTHDGHPVLRAHVLAAALAKGSRRRQRPDEDPSRATHYLKLTKKRGTGRYIDALVAGVLAEAARGQAIEEGALKARRPPPGAARARPADTAAPAPAGAGLWRPGGRLNI